MKDAGSRPDSAAWTDGELALALIAKDPAAPRLAFARFSPKVRNIVRRQLRSPADVEDSVQEVFLHLFRNVPSLRDPAAVERYLFAIALRTARRHGRKARARQRLLVPMPVAEWSAPVDVRAEHALRRLQRVLLRLKRKECSAFVLRFVAGMRVEEIASALGTSDATVRRRFARAFSRLSHLAGQDLFLKEYLPRPPG